MYYTKYRPQTFNEISKPNEVASALATQVKNEKTGHAYLFIGPRGTGKTTTARILAKALNCEKVSKEGDPCNACDACMAIKIGNYFDLIEIDAASNRGIDDIRDLKDKIKLAPTSGKQKIYIIDEVHMLTTEAFNALLKTLEEPPAHATFVLCTTEDHKVPATIKSRCQVFKFKRATVLQIVTKLEEILKAEKVAPKAKITKKDLEKIAKASFGGFRDAETLLQQIVEGELDVDSFVGTSSKEDFIDFMDALGDKDANSSIKIVNIAYENGIDLHTWAMEFVKYLRDLLFVVADAAEGLVDVPKEVFVSMEEQAKKFKVSQIAYITEVFIKALNEIKGSFITQLPLELAIIKICGGEFSPQIDIENSGIDGGDSNFELNLSGGKPKTENKKKKRSRGADFSMGAKSTLSTSFEKIESSWGDVLKTVVEHNHGVQALLKSSKPVAISGENLILEVFYKFHKERLESPKNKSIVETVLEDIFGERIGLYCNLSAERPVPLKKNESGNLTDMNVTAPSTDLSMGEALVDVFDGALPM